LREKWVKIWIASSNLFIDCKTKAAFKFGRMHLTDNRHKRYNLGRVMKLGR
jgi:hypothetical protein